VSWAQAGGSWSPGRKGGRPERRAGTPGFGLVWNCNECAGRVSSYGAVLRDSSSDRYRTASRYAARRVRSSSAVWSVLEGRPQGRAKGIRGGAYPSGPGRADSFGCPTDPQRPQDLFLRPRSGRRSSPSCLYGSVRRRTRPHGQVGERQSGERPAVGGSRRKAARLACGTLG